MNNKTFFRLLERRRKKNDNNFLVGWINNKQTNNKIDFGRIFICLKKIEKKKFEPKNRKKIKNFLIKLNEFFVCFRCLHLTND